MKACIFFLLWSVFVFGDDCGGNCLEKNCPSCPCGNKPNPVNIGPICTRYNWNQICCHCIVKAESNGNTNSMKYVQGKGFYVGLFHINQMYWQICNKEKPPCEELTNAICAIQVYQMGGNSWWLWSTAKQCGCDN